MFESVPTIKGELLSSDLTLGDLRTGWNTHTFRMLSSQSFAQGPGAALLLLGRGAGGGAHHAVFEFGTGLPFSHFFHFSLILAVVVHSAPVE